MERRTRSQCLGKQMSRRAEIRITKTRNTHQRVISFSRHLLKAWVRLALEEKLSKERLPP